MFDVQIINLVNNKYMNNFTIIEINSLNVICIKKTLNIRINSSFGRKHIFQVQKALNEIVAFLNNHTCLSRNIIKEK